MAAFTNYHGWSNAVSLNNGVVEAVIVPTVGRVQQFRFVGDTNGALWEDPQGMGQGCHRFRLLSELRRGQSVAVAAIRVGLAAAERIRWKPLTRFRSPTALSRW